MINAAGGIYTTLVVVLFAVVKFTEGAWLIVILFPALVYLLIRLNREYRHEAAILDDLNGGALRPNPPNYSRRAVLVLVDSYDLATIAALKYAKSLRPTSLQAVHFSVDSTRAGKLRRQWLEAGTGTPLELADCPDRRLAHAAARLAAAVAATPGTHVTVVLPRRSYPVLASRLLHDHTADRIARVVSRVPSAAATIIPFDVRHKVETLKARRQEPQDRWPPELRMAGAATRRRSDRVAAGAPPGHRTGPTARDPGPACSAQQRTGLRGGRLDRRADGRVLRPHPDRRRRAGPPGPVARHGRYRRGRPSRDDQPGLRAAAISGVGGFTRLMLGSTAGQVVQHAHCPVLIVPPEDRD